MMKLLQTERLKTGIRDLEIFYDSRPFDIVIKKFDEVKVIVRLKGMAIIYIWLWVTNQEVLNKNLNNIYIRNNVVKKTNADFEN